MSMHFLTEEEIKETPDGFRFTGHTSGINPSNETVEYFKKIAGYEFEEDVLHQWIKAQYGERVHDYLYHVDKNTRTILHFALKAFFDELSNSGPEVRKWDDLKRANVIAIVNKVDLEKPERNEIVWPTFYFKEMSGNVDEIESAQYAWCFQPGSESETKTLEYLVSKFPEKEFFLMPWEKAFDLTRHLEYVIPELGKEEF